MATTRRNFVFLCTAIGACLLGTSSGRAGFISSNGMGTPVGLTCVEAEGPGGRREFQLKMADDSFAWVARRVEFPAGGSPRTTVLTTLLHCAESHGDEPAIENTCTGVSFEGQEGEVARVIPHRGQVYILLEMRTGLPALVKDWLIFPSEKCEVRGNLDILP